MHMISEHTQANGQLLFSWNVYHNFSCDALFFSWQNKNIQGVSKRTNYSFLLFVILLHMKALLYHMVNTCDYTERDCDPFFVVVAYAESKTFWTEHFCSLDYNFYFLQYNGRKHMELWLVSLSIYFVFIIDQMLLQALNLRLAINILPDWISAWQLVPFRSQWQCKLW